MKRLKAEPERMHVALHFGALVPSIREQLKANGQRLRPDVARSFQRGADAIIYLSVHGYLTDGEKRRARLRLVNAIARHVRKVD